MYIRWFITFESVDKNLEEWPLKCKLLSHYFLLVLFVVLYKVVLSFDSVLKYDSSNEQYFHEVLFAMGYNTCFLLSLQTNF